jgi:glyoxylase-like metal-dependent hydrolase (beta-lactamase superfamily II)
VRDLRRGPEPWFVLTGDTLFSGAVGRPDLPGRPVDDARRLHASIQRLLALPDDVEVHPAHFGGSACGAGLSGKPVTTIGFERRWNPLLTAGADDFVRRVGTDLPSPPAGADETVAHNRGLR